MSEQPDFTPLPREELEGIAADAETFDPRRHPLGSLRALLADLALSALHYLRLAEGYQRLRNQNRTAQASHRQSIRDEAARHGVSQAVIREARSRKVPVEQILEERNRALRESQSP